MIELKRKDGEVIASGKTILSACEENTANLRGANLQGANLQGANLRDANSQGAYLQGANLQGANLQGANLQGANLQGANLRGVILKGVYLNWQSHDLIAEILRQHADTSEKVKIAGFILISREKCWNDFIALGDPLTNWAIGVLCQWKDESSPYAIKEYMKVGDA